MGLVITPKNCDVSVKKAIQQLSRKLEHVDVFSFTASRLVSTNSSQELVSVSDLTSWVDGTTNQVTVTDDADGTVTLSTPQDIHVDATPEFAGMTVKDSSDNVIFYVDNDEMYFPAAPAVGLTGQSIGLLLSLTYAS